MVANPYTPPTGNPVPVSALQSLLRILTWLTYPFLVFSIICIFALPGGLAFAMAFVSEFTIINSSEEDVHVTPVGTVGRKGKRRPLPICSRTSAFPASKRGHFFIKAGDKLDLAYDMDDINFSKIVVERDGYPPVQLVVNPNPANNQYQAPDETTFALKQLESLPRAPASVVKAAANAQTADRTIWHILGFVATPWIVFAMLKKGTQQLATTNETV